MTVKELIKILIDCPQEAQVELSIHPLFIGTTDQNLEVWDGGNFVLIYAGITPMQRGSVIYSEDEDE